MQLESGPASRRYTIEPAAQPSMRRSSVLPRKGMPPTGLEQAVEATTVPWGTRLGPRGEGRMPPGVDRRYASAEPIQRELKVGFERAFLAVPGRPSDLWVRT